MCSDRQHARVQSFHHCRGVPQTLFGANDLHITMHDIADLHGALLSESIGYTTDPILRRRQHGRWLSPNPPLNAGALLLLTPLARIVPGHPYGRAIELQRVRAKFVPSL